MRVHVVPVGTSLLQKLHEGVVDGLIKHALLAQPLAEELKKATNEHGVLDLAATLTSDHELSTEILDLLRDEPASGCAEWSGLARVGVEEAGVEEVGVEEVGDDAMVFVASDTDDGLRAAVLVAARYAHRDTVAVRYVPDPLDPATALPSVLGQRQILVVRVPGLDLAPGSARPNENTWRSLGELGAVLAHTASQRDLDVVFHLTGGYKALLPYLLVVAEGVQSVVRHRTQRSAARVQASCLYEAGEHRVLLPIRWLVGDLLEAATAMSTAAADGVDVEANKFHSLRGMYLEDDATGDRRKLTDAGLIIARTLWALDSQRRAT